MKLLCRLFGHKHDPRDYGRVWLRSVDGTGAQHAEVFTFCRRCRQEFDLAKIHIPVEGTRAYRQIEQRLQQLRATIDTPELRDFDLGVRLEAAHQRERWGSDHDAGKEPEDWLWLLGYLGGKALRAAKDGDTDKALHHTISTAAALRNWHAALLGVSKEMRPGIGPGNPVFEAVQGRAPNA